MTNLLIAPPWYLLLTLVIVGCVVAFSGNQRQQARTRNAGLVLLAVAAVWFGLGFVFETDLAKVKRLNGQLVQSVPGRDWGKFAELLDPDATLDVVGGTLFDNRAALVAGAKADADASGLKSVAVLRTEEKQGTPDTIIVDIDVLSRQDATENMGFPNTTSSWRMQWERDEKAWRCHQITCLKIGNESPGSIAQHLK